jgi:hypothetical protein
MYDPARVSIIISSPIFTNRGTCMTPPVSTVAGFDPPAIQSETTWKQFLKVWPHQQTSTYVCAQTGSIYSKECLLQLIATATSEKLRVSDHKTTITAGKSCTVRLERVPASADKTKGRTQIDKHAKCEWTNLHPENVGRGGFTRMKLKWLVCVCDV